jgi:hypothetical protein
VTSFMAMMVASAAGLLLRDPLDGLLGVVPGEALGAIVGIAVYFVTRRWLAELRNE